MAIGDEFTIGDYTYRILDEPSSFDGIYSPGIVNAQAAVKTKTSYANIPSSVTNGAFTYRVWSMDNCFDGCENLVSAPAIPSTITSMVSCFSNCVKLVNAPTIPSGVWFMSYCFERCTSLTTAPTIPSGVMALDSAFSECTSLVNPPSIPARTFEEDQALWMTYCFYGCTSMTSAPVINNNGRSVYMRGCFMGCASLVSPPAIPSTVNNLENCFNGCISLTTAPTIPNGVTDLTSCFEDCRALTTPPAIPSGVVYMNRCFSNCWSLTSAPSIPNSVKEMSYCFDTCWHLTSPPTIQSNAAVLDMQYCFTSCTALTTPPVIPSSVTILDGTFWDCQNLATPPTIPNGVVTMVRCFGYCESLTSAPAIPSSVRYMNQAFYHCESLITPPTIPSTASITDMQRCFFYCKSMTSAPTIPASVTNLENTFTRCEALTSPPTIPSNSAVTTMNSCFAGCSNLTSAPEIPSGVTQMVACFMACPSLSGNIVVHNSPTLYNSMFTTYTSPSQPDIYIMSDTVNPWKAIANEYTYVHLRCASATSAPTISASGRRTNDGETTESDLGEYAYLLVTPVVDTENWYGNVTAMALTLDGDVEAVTWLDSNGDAVASMETGQTYHTWVTLGDLLSHRFSLVATDSAGKISSNYVITLSQVYALMSFKAGGTGAAIGGVATHDGFDISMDTYAYGERDYPMFTKTSWDASSSVLSLTTTPCFVLSLSDSSLWYCDADDQTTPIRRVTPELPLPIANGGTGANTAASARLNLRATGAAVIESSTMANIIDTVRTKSGQCGSFNLSTEYTLSDITVATGWYNYIYIPHRDGVASDASNYGTLIFTSMTGNTPVYFLRYSNGSAAQLKALSENGHTHNFLSIVGDYGGSTHAAALKSYFDANKSTTPRNKLINMYSSAYGNGSQAMGYFLQGYDSSPYGGFFVAHYNTPYYVGIDNGTYTQWELSKNGHTHSYLPLSGGTLTGALNLSFNGAYVLVKDTGIDLAASNNGISSGVHYPAFYVSDNAGRIVARMEAVVNSNGNNGVYLYARNYNTSGTEVAQKGILITTNKSGDAWCDIQCTTYVNGDIFLANTSYAMLRTETTGDRINYMSRANNYLHISTWNYGNFGVTWWSSDIRLKDNIADSTVDALEVVNQIQHRSFDMKSDGEHHDIGYVAQELEKLDPQMVTKVYQSREVAGVNYFTGDYAYQIDERKIIPYLSKSIQQLSQENDELRAKNAELEARLERIEKELGL